MKGFNKVWISVVAAAAALALVPLTSSADTTSGRDYGQHVAACAQAMGGFSGSDNPGMHQGFAGWNGSACNH